MNREHVLKVPHDCREELADKFGVREIGIFGSAARDALRADSDIDVLVEFGPERTTGLFSFVGLRKFLERKLGRKVDLTTRSALKRQLKDRILRDYVDAA